MPRESFFARFAVRRWGNVILFVGESYRFKESKELSPKLLELSYHIYGRTKI